MTWGRSASRFLIVSTFCVAIPWLNGAPIAVAQSTDGIELAINGFLDAFNNLDMARFISCFAQDATMFHPPAAAPRAFPKRLRGRSEIQRTFQVVFDQIRERSGRTAPPFMNLQPEDLLIQNFDGFTIVTFHLGTEQVRGRRTLVFQRVGSEWKIVHLHASTFDAQRQ